MEIQDLISNLGFPIFVAVWMMIKNSKDLNGVKDAIQSLVNELHLQQKGDRKND